MTPHRLITVITVLLAASWAVLLASPAAAVAATAGPADLRVTGTTYDSVSLAWSPAAGSVAYYQILRNGVWVNTSYGTTGSVRYLAAGTTSTFEVRARDSSGNVSAPVSVSASTLTDAAPPTAPPNFRVVTDAVGRPSGLAWDGSTDNRGVATYVLFADGSDAFGGGQGVSFEALTDEFCTVQRGQTYSFTVRALDLTGNLSPLGTSVTVTVP